MGRRVRFLPEGDCLVEVTCRTIQGRHLLRPGPRLNRLVVGVLARAQRMYPVGIHACVVMSNHYHLLLSVPDSRRLSQFMNFFQSNLAREAGRLHNWRDRFWGRRYSAIMVSGEERAQLDRLRYILSHGVKEGLVAEPQGWPGVNCVRALLDARRLEGMWIDRTRQWQAQPATEETRGVSHTTTEFVALDKMPCWAHLEGAEYRQRIRDLLSSITSSHKHPSSSMATRRAQLPHDPHHRPSRLKRECAPWFHCASEAVRRELREAYSVFLSAYREASERLRRGDPNAPFPEGSFPPPLPFVA